MFQEAGERAQSVLLDSCDPMDYSAPDASVHGGFPGENSGVSCHFLLQGIFPPRD